MGGDGVQGVHVGRLIAGHEEEPSHEATAGGILDAEFAIDVREIADMLRSLKG